MRENRLAFLFLGLGSAFFTLGLSAHRAFLLLAIFLFILGAVLLARGRR